MTFDECQPGDLVTDTYGLPLIVGRRTDWSRGSKTVYCHKATKGGKIDKRFAGYGSHIQPERLTLVRRGADDSVADRTPERAGGFDLWLYHDGAGWWLDEEGKTKEVAAELARRKLGTGNVVAVAILPAGQRLGLFTKEYGK